ncbi:amidohydrolase family protein [Paraburkholderia strydomiana]|uniref:amidohydrolase family protein n=1 Tax=Paraburkholderia strydomiana TaxID=1245417 RepID=UPI0038BB0E36
MDSKVSTAGAAFDARRRALTLALAAGGMVSWLRTPPARAAGNPSFSNSSGSEHASLKAPAMACDAHIHIYDDRFPIVNANATLPRQATVEDYRKIQSRLGTTRTVIVQPANYGTDNRITLDAISKLGADKTRGIAVVSSDISDEELLALHQGGIRGVRFSLFEPKNAVTRADMIEPVARRIHDLGWHIQLQMRSDLIVGNGEMLKRLPCPVVFDHMARLPQTESGRDAYNVIRGMLDHGRTWVKVSAAYLNTKVGPPSYEDATRMARSYIDAAPERAVWGSDWPHPTEKYSKPDDAKLLDLLSVCAPEAASQHRILVDNPATLYGFGTEAT